MPIQYNLWATCLPDDSVWGFANVSHGVAMACSSLQHRGVVRPYGFLPTYIEDCLVPHHAVFVAFHHASHFSVAFLFHLFCVLSCTLGEECFVTLLSAHMGAM